MLYVTKLIPDHYFFGYKGSMLLRLKAEHNEMVLATRLEF